MRIDIKALIVITFLLGLFSINCFAAIPAEQKSLDIYQVLAVAPSPILTANQVADVIPTDIPSGSTGGTVSKMVLDKALKSALKSDFVKGSAVGETASNLKDGLNTEMAFGEPSTDPEAIQHKVKFKVDPIQTRAKVQYSGFVNASTTYDSGDVTYEVTEDFTSYKLNLSHKINDAEELSLVQVQWAW